MINSMAPANIPENQPLFPTTPPEQLERERRRAERQQKRVARKPLNRRKLLITIGIVGGGYYSATHYSGSGMCIY